MNSRLYHSVVNDLSVQTKRPLMAWHRRGLLLLTILVHAKIFGFDPGEDNTSSFEELTSESVRKSYTSEEPISQSITEVYTSVEPISESFSKIHTADSRHSWAHSHHTTLPDRSTETSAINAINSLSTEKTPGTSRDIPTLSTFANSQYINVDEHVNVSFSLDSTFNISMPECSMSAYLESYAVLWDLSLFKSLSLTTSDTQSCSISITRFNGSTSSTQFITYAGIPTHYIRAGSLTFASSDEWFVSTNDSINKRTGALCLRLRTPPYTNVVVGAASIQPWVELAKGLRVMLYKANSYKRAFKVGMFKQTIALGRHLRSPYNDVVLAVSGLHEAFQDPGRQLTLSLKVKTTCARPGLQVKYPTHNSTGGCLFWSRVSVFC